MMAASVAQDRLSADRIAALVSRCEGNPFFVEQLLAGGAVTTMSEDLAELLRSRAAATSSAAHDVLRALAVAGRPLSDDEVIELGEHLTAGVPFATPVFDGATETEIRAMLGQ